MPKVSVYLSDQQYAEAKRLGVSLSELTQTALEAELRRRSMAEWLDRVERERPRAKGPFDISALMDEVREEFGA